MYTDITILIVGLIAFYLVSKRQSQIVQELNIQRDEIIRLTQLVRVVDGYTAKALHKGMTAINSDNKYMTIIDRTVVEDD